MKLKKLFLFIVLVAFWCSANAAVHKVGTEAELKDKLKIYKDGDTIELNENITINSQIRVDNARTLTITGKKITRGENLTYSMFNIESTARLLLKDIIIDGGNLDNVISSIAVIYNDGRLTLKNGAVLQNNRITASDARGGAIRSFSGEFIMESGSIVTGNSVIGSNAKGGGVYGSLVVVNEGASITNNTATGSGAKGGGIYSYTSGKSTVDISGNVTGNIAVSGNEIYSEKDIRLFGTPVIGNLFRGIYFETGAKAQIMVPKIGDNSKIILEVPQDAAAGRVMVEKATTMTIYDRSKFKYAGKNLLNTDSKTIVLSSSVFDLQTAINNLGLGTSSNPELIIIPTDADIEITKTITVTANKHVKLTALKHIKRSTSFKGLMFKVEGTLHLEEIIIDGALPQAASADTGIIFSNGNLKLLDGAVLKNNKTAGNGGAIFNQGNLAIDGGTITGNAATKGGGIYHTGPGILTITGGKIVNNTLIPNSKTGGNEIYAEKPVFVEKSPIIGMQGKGICFTLWYIEIVNNLNNDARIFLEKPVDPGRPIVTKNNIINLAEYYCFSYVGEAMLELTADKKQIIIADFDLQKAIDISDGTATDPKEINVPKEYSISQTVTVNNKHVIIKGKTINRTSGFKGNMFSVSAGSSLTFADITVDGSLSAGQANGSIVSNAGTLNISTGAVLKNNKNAGNGGAIFNTGTLTVNGGNITGNTAPTGNQIYVSAGDLSISGLSVIGSSTEGGIYLKTGRKITTDTLYKNARITLEAFENASIGQVLIEKATDITTDDVNAFTYLGADFMQPNPDNFKQIILTDYDLQSEINQSNGNSSTPAVINIPKNILILKTIQIPSDKHVNITGAGKTIKRFGGFTDDIFNVAADATLVFENITIDGAPGTGDATGSIVRNSGNFELLAGAVLQNNKTTGPGGGVYNIGKMTMSTGSIENNETSAYNSGGAGIWNSGELTVSGTARITGNNAAGIGGTGGGIFNEGTLNITGGSIENNVVNTGGTLKHCRAGGVYNKKTLTVSGGSISCNKVFGPDSRGAGIYNDGSYDARCTISGEALVSGNILNKSASAGGGVYNSGKLIMEGGAVKDNSSLAMGGGVFNETANESTDPGFTMSGGVISGNKSYDGGGVYNNGKLAVSGGVIESDTASHWGGGVFNNNSMVMSGGTIRKDTASGGGGIYNASSLVITSADIKENKATSGGGIYNSKILELNGNRVFISSNKARKGGGIYNYFSETTTVSDANIENNEAEELGGGIYSNSKVILKGGKIKSNNAVEGGGVYISQDIVTMSDTVTVSSNKANLGGGIYFRGGELNVSGGNIENNTASAGNEIYIGAAGFNISDSAFIGTTDKGIYLKTGIKLTINPALGDNAKIVFEIPEDDTEGRVMAEKVASDVSIAELTKFVYVGTESLNINQINKRQIIKGGFDLQSAIDRSGGTAETPEEITIPVDIVIYDTITVNGKHVKITGAGKTLSRIDMFKGNMFKVSPGSTLQFTDITVDGALPLNAKADGSIVYNEGNLLTGPGALLKNNNNTAKGGAVYNTGTTQVAAAGIKNNTAAEGGGVYSTGTLKLSDTLTGNDATVGTDIYINDGNFFISGSAAAGTADKGVYLASGTKITIESDLAPGSAIVFEEPQDPDNNRVMVDKPGNALSDAEFAAFSYPIINTLLKRSADKKQIMLLKFDLQTEVNNSAGSAASPREITIPAEFDIKLGRTIELNGKHVKIIGGGKTIARADNFKDDIFKVSPGSTLEFQDIVIDGALPTGTRSGGSIVNNDGTFRLQAGAVLQNNNSSGKGAGVYNTGTMYMIAGKIQNNAAMNAAGVWNSGEINVTGGKIENNTGGTGSQIYMSAGNLKISGEPSITGIYLATGIKAEITGALGDNAEIVFESPQDPAAKRVMAEKTAGDFTDRESAMFDIVGGELQINTNNRKQIILFTVFDLQTEIDNSFGTTVRPAIITVPGNINITGTITVTGKHVKITGSKTITRAAEFTGDMFSVSAESTLELENITVNGANIPSGGSIVRNAGALRLRNSTVLQNNRNSAAGGGIYNSGSLETYGTVKVTGNTAIKGNDIYTTGSFAVSGMLTTGAGNKGIYLAGGAKVTIADAGLLTGASLVLELPQDAVDRQVMAEKATAITDIEFEMFGGSDIILEKSTDKKQILLKYFDLQDAIDKSAGTSGTPAVITVPFGIKITDTIKVNGKHVKITGDTVTRADSFTGNMFTVSTGSTLEFGDITVDGASSADTPSDGSIVHNAGSLRLGSGAILQNNNTVAYGGGVYNIGTEFKIAGNAAITDNKTQTYGNAVYTGGDISVSGSPVIGSLGRGVYLASTAKIIIDGALAGPAIVLEEPQNPVAGRVMAQKTTTDITDAEFKYFTYAGNKTKLQKDAKQIKLATAAAFNLQTAINNSNGTAAAPELIIVPANAADTLITATITVNGKHVKIAGSKPLVRAKGFVGGMFEVKTNSTLELADITLDGNKTVVPDAEGSIVKNEGTLRITAGAMLQNNSISGRGGGVYNIGAGAVFKITGGSIKGNKAAYGAGVYNESGGELTMSGTALIENNEATGSGGGVLNFDAGTVFAMSGGSIKGNKAAYGAGVYNYLRGELTMSGTALIENNEATGSGGGVLNFDAGTVFAMSGGSIKGNKAAYGAGVYNYLRGELTMSGTALIENNEATGSGGGVLNFDAGTVFAMSGGSIKGNKAESGAGVFNRLGGELTMSGTALIENNEAYYEGGGVSNTGAGTVFKITGGSIKGNKAKYGAGVYNYLRGELTMSGTALIENNEATGSGGGVYNYGAGTVFKITGGSIKGNKAKYGAGVYNTTGGELTMSGTALIENNEAGDHGGGVYNIGTFTMSGGSIKGNKAALGNELYVYNSYYANVKTQLSGTPVIGGAGKGIYLETGQTLSILAPGLAPGATVVFEQPQDPTEGRVMAEKTATDITDAEFKYFTYAGNKTKLQKDAKQIKLAFNLQTAINNSNGTAAAPELIIVPANAADTLITATITVNGKHVKITGSKPLVRAKGFKGNMFEVKANSTLELADITLDGNKTVAPDAEGSIVRNEGTLRITAGAMLQNNSISYDHGHGRGGGVYNIGAGAVFAMSGGSIKGNKANSGAGVYNESGGELTMSGTALIENNEAGYDGGGVSNTEPGTVFKITGGTIKGNKANSGAGVYNESGGELTMSGTALIENNEASPGRGGGVSNTGAGAVFKITGGIIKGNKAEYGAGVHNESGGELTMSGTALIENNEAPRGGGVLNFDGAVFAMSGGTIKGNKANSGAGVYNTTGGELTMSGTALIENNEAGDDGGGVLNYGTFTMSGGSIKGNKAKYGAGVNNSWGELTMSGTALIENNEAGYDGGGVYNTGTFNMSGGSIKGNKAVSGAGVSNKSRGELTMSGTALIENNEAGVYGGGVYNSGAGTVFKITGGSIKGNKAKYGAGVYNYLRGELTMSGTALIENNEANYDGGGVHNSVEGAVFAMSGGSIKGNKASSGAGVYNTTGGELTMSGTALIENNEATKEGGGVSNYNAELTMSGTALIENNEAGDHGGGVYNIGTFTMSGGSIKGNKAALGNEVYVYNSYYANVKTQLSGTPVIGGAGKGIYLETGQTLSILAPGLAPGAAVVFEQPQDPAAGRVMVTKLTDITADEFAAFGYIPANLKLEKSGKNIILAKISAVLQWNTADGGWAGTVRTVTYNGAPQTVSASPQAPATGTVNVYYYTRGNNVSLNTAPTDAGRYDIRAELVDNNYTAPPITGKLIIEPAAVSDVTGISDSEYTGSAVEMPLTVKSGSATLIAIRDYTVVYDNNINAGTAKVTVTGTGNYTGIIEKTFEITPKAITSVDAPNQVYTGSALEPDIVVKSADIVLMKGVDYDAVFTDNIAVGTAKVKVTGKNNYKGTIDAEFNIVNDMITAVDGLLAEFDYTGTEITQPGLIVKSNAATLTEGTDYKLVYGNNINAGTATVTVMGMGGYGGSISETFTIKPVEITVTPKAGQSKTFGTADPVFAYDNTTLLGTDKFTGALSRVSGNNVGKYKITQGNLSADGNYTIKFIDGVEFEITAKEITVTPKAGQSKTFGTADPALAYDNTTLLGTDKFTGALSRVLGNNVGKYKITQGNLSAGGNYTIKFIDGVEFEITAKALATVEAIADQTYTGSAITPAVTVKDADKTLVLNTDYTVTFADNVNTGTAKITVIGNNNYFGAIEKNFNIIKSTPAITLQPLTTVYTGMPISITPVTPSGAAGASGLKVSYTYNGLNTIPIDAGTYNVIATTEIHDNFESVSSEPVTLEIQKVTPVIKVTNLSQNYTGNPIPIAQPTVEGSASANNLELAYKYESTDGGTYNSSAAPTNRGAYKVTVSTDGDRNHNRASATATLTISQNAPTIELDDKTTVYDGTRIKINPARVSPAEASDFTVSYKYKGTLKDGSNYPESTTAPSEAGNYTVTASTAAQGKFEAAGATASLTINKAAASIKVENKTTGYTGSAISIGTPVTVPTNATLTYNYTGEDVVYDSSNAPKDAGNYIVTVTFSGNNNYEPASATAKLSIQTGIPGLTLKDKTITYDGSPVSIDPVVIIPDNAGLTASYTYAGTKADGTAYAQTADAPTDAGTYTVTAKTAAKGSYFEASVTAVIKIERAAPSLTLQSMSADYTGLPIAITPVTPSGVTGASGLTVKYYYTSSDYNGETPPTDAGSYAVHASTAVNNNFNSVSATPVQLTINKVTPVIKVTNLSQNYTGNPIPIAQPTVEGSASANNLELAYKYESTDGGTYNSSAAPTNRGAYKVTVSTDGDRNHNRASATATLTISQNAPTIELDDKTTVYDGTRIKINPARVSPAEASDFTVTYKYKGTLKDGSNYPESTTAPSEAGNYTVTASTAAQGKFEAAGATASLTINKAAASIKVENKTTGYTGSAISIGTPVTVPTNATLTYNYTGEDVAYDSPNAPKDAGNYIVTVTFSGNNNYEPASATAKLSIQTGIPGLTLKDKTVTYDGSPVSIDPVVIIPDNAGLTASYTYAGTKANGTAYAQTTDAPTDAGTYTVTAKTAASGSYAEASVTAILKIERAPQTITFDPIPEKKVGDNDFNLEASASSGEKLSYSSGNESVASVDADGKVTIKGPGTVTIIVSQPGSNNYLTAESKAQQLTVIKLTVEPVIDKIVIENKTYESPAQTIEHIGDCGSGNNVTVTVSADASLIVEPGRAFEITFDKPGVKEQSIKVTNSDGAETIYTVRIRNPFAFADIISQKWNNVLMIDVNKLKDMGYVFETYTWYCGDDEIASSGKPYYSAGNKASDRLNKDKQYRVEMKTVDGRVIHTCPQTIEWDDFNIVAYPNPVQNGGTVNIKADIDERLLKDATIEIYDLQGRRSGTTVKVTGNFTTVNMPAVPGMYILNLKGNDGFRETFKIIVE